MTPLMQLSENDNRNPISEAKRLNPIQMEAIDRLIGTLEPRLSEFAGRPNVTPAQVNIETLSQRARLCAAHASYGLETSTEMLRIGYGAWLHRRHA